MQILDGKKLRDAIGERLKDEIKSFKEAPALAILQIGDREDSNVYIDSKKKFGSSIGVEVRHEKLSSSAGEEEILEKIDLLNNDSRISGIIVQLPLPKNLDKEKIVNAIAPSKDVDGLGALNMKKMWEGKPEAFIPATTKGILSLLSEHGIALPGKHVVVVGRSDLVGKPTAIACLMNDASVTVLHSKSGDLKKYTKTADILIVAAGQPKLITKEHVSPGQVIIDVGINPVSKERFPESLENEIPGKNLVGDVEFENVKDVVHAISPVPGGVGPMTVASLFENVLEAYKRGK